MQIGRLWCGVGKGGIMVGENKLQEKPNRKEQMNGANATTAQ